MNKADLMTKADQLRAEMKEIQTVTERLMELSRKTENNDIKVALSASISILMRKYYPLSDEYSNTVTDLLQVL